jgi:hypothetical protein
LVRDASNTRLKLSAESDVEELDDYTNLPLHMSGMAYEYPGSRRSDWRLALLRFAVWTVVVHRFGPLFPPYIDRLSCGLAKAGAQGTLGCMHLL